MTIFAVGDVHGHYDALARLLEQIHFSDDDWLWLTGDLVNRGTQSAEVLRFVHGFRHKEVVLGNHDFSVLVQAQDFKDIEMKKETKAILKEDDGEELIDGLRRYPLMLLDEERQVLMTHAGLYPRWNEKQGLALAQGVSERLQAHDYRDFLHEVYGDEPRCWREDLEGMDLWRFTINAFCRMRYLDEDWGLNLRAKGSPDKGKEGIEPWFKKPQQSALWQYFGHWASLGDYAYGRCRCLDGGYAWGGKLMAWNVSENRLAGQVFYQVY
ncbi:MAG: symmetrical bis(5'-nucleosyl)-tetraphosphatase [Cardiobacteriaceae bacterium]|nr:symmetrical bis(5'-nucleosyl)-tetraphosphatase [Cardiobacteriaceae bacterium]